MSADNLRSRKSPEPLKPEPDLGAEGSVKVQAPHPAGPVRHGPVEQALRLAAFVIYFTIGTTILHGTQIVGLPLYFINRDYFYAWISMTKLLFGLVVNTITEWFAPTVLRISGDESVRGQLIQLEDGRLGVDFPERLVMLSNHQIYTDWLYLWWICYTGGMHGHFFIILKESLQFIPTIGPGMILFGFIFLARNWAKDKPRFQRRLQQLKTTHKGPMSGKALLDPAWLLIFPEGTNLSKNGRVGSRKWADKTGLKDLRHALLPRSTGLQFCLQELKGTLEWVYDCTISYEGIPPGQYGQDIFTLYSSYFQGRVPKSVNIYWRRFAVSSIPLNDSKAFEIWLRDRWTEKDQFLEQFVQTGRFPADESGIIFKRQGDSKTNGGYIETSVRNKSGFEFLLIFVPMAIILITVTAVYKLCMAVLALT